MTAAKFASQGDTPPNRRHAFWGWAGLRRPIASHSHAEHQTLQRWASNARTIVEIGVAEGTSALAMREVMAQDGTLYLIDPFHLSRVPVFNFTRRIAHRLVESERRGKVVWIERFSHDVSREWKAPIDFMFIDGDHEEAAVKRDWQEWSPFVVSGGTVAFHDARLFPGGWTTPDTGPVRVIDDVFRRGDTRDWTIVDEVDSIVVVRKN